MKRIPAKPRDSLAERGNLGPGVWREAGKPQADLRFSRAKWSGPCRLFMSETMIAVNVARIRRGFFRAPMMWAMVLGFWINLGIAAQAEFGEIQSRIQEFTLGNGLKFLVLARPQAPVASFYTYADVGSAQETKGITGLAHIFEHMAFKGTQTIGTRDAQAEKIAMAKIDQAFAMLQQERRKGDQANPERLKQLTAEFQSAQQEAAKYVVKNEFGDIIERAGGRGLNASTATDRTDYFFSLPSNAAELWFYLESERFRDPVLREFYRERDVVMEERRMRTESNPIGKLIEDYLSVAYKAHPYGEPTIGHMSDLVHIRREDAEAFFNKHYVPSNLTAAVVGDVDPKRIRELAEAYFARLPARPKPDPVRTEEPPQEGERRLTLRLQAQRLILMGFHKPGILHPDNAVYDALGSLLSEGRSSRLQRNLVRDQKLAVDIGGFPGFPGQKYPGLFLFYAFTAPGHSNAEVETALLKEIERLQKEPVSKAELDGVKRRARANLIRQLDDNMGLASNLATYHGLTGDWRNLFRQLDKINAVTPEDIQRVAKATFTEKNRTIGIIEPIETADINLAPSE